MQFTPNEQEAERPTSRNIPLPIQRQVRQRCGFGCVVCGLPLYEYDHLLGWERGHIADEIILLCDLHHRERTQGLLPDETVREANANPYNLRQGVSKPYALHFEGDSCEVIIGNNRFAAKDRGYGTVSIPLMIDGIPLLAFILADGHLLLNVVLFDEYNHRILHIKNNHLLFSVSPWDIEFKGRQLTIREAPRQFLIRMAFEPPNRVVVDRARFLCNGVEVLIEREHILVTNNSSAISGSEFSDVPVGLAIGPMGEQMSCGIHLGEVSRYLGDSSESKRWLRESEALFRQQE